MGRRLAHHREGYPALLEPLAVISRMANSAKSLKSMAPVRVYLYDTLLEGLAQDLQDVAAELRQFIQKEHPMVGQRHFARHRRVPPADQPYIGDGVMWGATRAGYDPRRTIPREGSDATDVGGVDRCGQAR